MFLQFVSIDQEIHYDFSSSAHSYAFLENNLRSDISIEIKFSLAFDPEIGKKSFKMSASAYSSDFVMQIFL